MPAYQLSLFNPAKPCSRCGVVKPLTAYSIARRLPSGQLAACKECENARVKQYRERNLEAVQAKDRARYHAAPEKHHRKHYPYGTFKRDPGKQARWFRSWLERNREKFYASIRAWTADHPEVRIASANNRRTRTRANGGRFTAAEWRTLKKRYAYRCLACGVQEPAIRLQPDHIIPVSKGGSGNIDNIQPLCPRCNRVKHTKEVDYRSAAAFAPPPRVAGSVSVSDEEQ